MKSHPLLILAAALSLIAVGFWNTGAAQEKLEISGTWKLVVLAFGEDEFASFNVAQENKELQAKVAKFQEEIFPSAEVTGLKQEADHLHLGLKLGPIDTEFTGELPKQGDTIKGTFLFRGSYFPAHFVKAEKTDLKEMSGGPGELVRKVLTQRREADAKKRVAALREIIAENKDNPTIYHAYQNLLASAAAAELSADDVKKTLDAYLALAKPYGKRWQTNVRMMGLQALAGDKPYAALSVEIAQNLLEKHADRLDTEQTAEIYTQLASAAELAGKADLAKEAEAKVAELQVKLDQEYLKKVPPFEVKPYAGRENKQANRTVLLELFTGAECPPCVAADVAFDALLEAYQTDHMIGLQYHLHIPGPDPLTNPATEARSRYYQVRGTPSIYFNGHAHPEARGGGPMQASPVLYERYQKVLNELLETEKKASIELQVTRNGDKLQVAAKANIQGEPADDAKYRLRLVLAEESIRYVGGNDLRFHHHVVRDMPGGVDGKELAAGKGELTATVDLAELKKKIEGYVQNFGNFRHPLPPVKLENLSVIALVQNDEGKEVLQAVVKAVPKAAD